MGDDQQFLDLCGIYEGMNDEGRKKLLLAGRELLSIKKLMLEDVPSLPGKQAFGARSERKQRAPEFRL